MPGISSLPKWKRALQKKAHAYAIATSELAKEKEALTVVEERLRDLQEAQGLAQKVATQVQNRAHRRISELVSRCLETVFDEPYVFKILFEKKRGRTEARLVFERDGLEVDPLTAAGGGVVDVASFALRVACLLLSRPSLRHVLVLDEPFRFVSTHFRSRVRQLLLSLSEELGIQILLVTHDPQLQVGKVVDLGGKVKSSRSRSLWKPRAYSEVKKNLRKAGKPPKVE